MKNTPVINTVLAIAIAISLTACGDKEGKKVATQVAAKVGSEEISVHQINQVLSRTPTSGASPEAVQAMGKEVLEKLIDQQLAVDEATENKLHRSPEVVAQIEAARREILARAYFQQVSAGVAKPSSEEVKKYYSEHPQLFSERRIFNVQEIIAANATGNAELLKGFVVNGKSMEEIAAALKSREIKFSGGSATRAAEQIPLEILPKVHALKDGQVTIFEAPQAITVLRVVSSQQSPVAETAALPRIAQFLANQRAGEAIAENMKQLRASAKIRYMGEFEKGTVPETSTTESPVPKASDDQTKSVIEKGASGLK